MHSEALIMYQKGTQQVNTQLLASTSTQSELYFIDTDASSAYLSFNELFLYLQISGRPA